jgi:hypothetical protein
MSRVLVDLPDVQIDELAAIVEAESVHVRADSVDQCPLHLEGLSIGWRDVPRREMDTLLATFGDV